MNRDDIIRWAREANRYASNQTGDSHEWQEIRDERFANLVAAAEREECAKVCDELHWSWYIGDSSGPKECAEAIRARGDV